MTLDVGILGYRFMGKAHSNALDRLPMFFPDAPATNRDVLVGRNEEALAEAADRLGFDRTATDWSAVVDEVDVFYNLGPNHVHAEPTIAALEAGTPVLCEKPLARTLPEAEEIAAAADDAGVPAGTAFNYRFIPAIQYAKRLIENGEIGEIRHVRGRYLQDWLVDPEAAWSWRNDEELAGSGALGDLGAHTIDLLQFLVGEQAGPIERLSGHCETFVEERPTADGEETRPVTVDDAFSAQLEFADGVMGTIEATRMATGHKNDHTIEIEGSDGALSFSLERLNELEVMRANHRGFETVLVTDESDPYVDAWWPPGHVLGWEHTFVHENYEFLSAAATGTTDALAASNVATVQDGLAVQRVLDAIQASDERGAWVEVQ
ncbi:Gfo/Idh/MocA family protein [Salinarchaeum laminariae]|uniref:Gfo/Idh/MocA family protein n=1 Tax=Salinarchaeum laminariae TaxID=869888 RepID=UPI0020BEF36C|nr:Gfo/Idh/MocA family oxidoreductase [Salinarchaeum laminariae]